MSKQSGDQITKGKKRMDGIKKTARPAKRVRIREEKEEEEVVEDEEAPGNQPQDAGGDATDLEEEEDAPTISKPEASPVINVSPRKFKVPKPLLAAFETFLGSIIQEVADEGARQATKEVKQGPSRAKPRPKKRHVEPKPTHNPVYEIYWLITSASDPKDALVKCAKGGCQKWYHVKCTTGYLDKSWDRRTDYVCTEADQGCSELPHQERQRIHEADEVETRKAAGKENVGDVTPPRERAKSEASRVDDKFGGKKCRGKSNKAEDMKGCQKPFRISNPPAECEFEGCQENNSFCTNCKEGKSGGVSGRKGFVLMDRTGEESIWVCCERCRENCEEEGQWVSPSQEEEEAVGHAQGG